jgi:hypothetical protein
MAKKLAKKGNGAIALSADAQAEMDKALEAISDKIGQAGGEKISLKNKRFTFPDGHQEDGPFQFIILGWISANFWWEEDYDEKSPTPPDCWAHNENPKLLVSSPNSTNRQNDEACSDCPMDVFGTAKVGEGKACKNNRLLAVVAADSVDEEDAIMKIEVAPTSLRNFDGFVTTLQSKGTLPVQVVTEIGFDDGVSYPKLLFKGVGWNENAEMHWGRRDEATKMLLVEPDPASSAPKKKTPTPSTGRKTNKKTAKKTAKKTGGRSAGSRRV